MCQQTAVRGCILIADMMMCSCSAENLPYVVAAGTLQRQRAQLYYECYGKGEKLTIGRPGKTPKEAVQLLILKQTETLRLAFLLNLPICSCCNTRNKLRCRHIDDALHFSRTIKAQSCIGAIDEPKDVMVWCDCSGSQRYIMERHSWCGEE